MKQKCCLLAIASALISLGQMCGSVEPPPVEESSSPSPSGPQSPSINPSPQEPALPDEPPATAAPEIVSSLAVRSEVMAFAPSGDQMTYFWLDKCTPESPAADPWGEPKSESLFAEFYPDLSEHFIFAKFGVEHWPVKINKASLWMYLVAYEEDAWLPLFPVGLEVYRLGKDWRPGPPDPATWQRYCYNSLPLVDKNGGYCEETPESGGKWYEVDITRSCQAWAEGWPNYGLFVRSVDEWYALNFASPSYADAGLRPQVQIEYEPFQLKLPLPPGAWQVTTEPGGGDCASAWIDEFHTGNHFYSIDFAPWSCNGSIELVYREDVPVLASADGVVVASGYSDPNGNYVFVKHSGLSGPEKLNPEKGLVTKYLHLAAPSNRKVGEEVAQGSFLGTLGNSGIYTTGRHLHFGVCFNGDGSQAVPEFQYVVLEGRPLDQWKIRCLAGQRVTYYQSTNE